MTAPSLAEIVGTNLRRVRESRQLTRSDTVRLIWERTGQAWSISEIDILENAKRVSVTVNDLATLACAFDLPTLAFLDGNGAVQIGDGFRVPLESLMGDAAPRRGSLRQTSPWRPAWGSPVIRQWIRLASCGATPPPRSGIDDSATRAPCRLAACKASEGR